MIHSGRKIKCTLVCFFPGVTGQLLLSAFLPIKPVPPGLVYIVLAMT